MQSEHSAVKEQFLCSGATGPSQRVALATCERLLPRTMHGWVIFKTSEAHFLLNNKMQLCEGISRSGEY